MKSHIYIGTIINVHYCMYYGSDFSEVYVGYGVCKSNNIDKAIKKYTVIASTVLPMHVNL